MRNSKLFLYGAVGFALSLPILYVAISSALIVEPACGGRWDVIPNCVRYQRGLYFALALPVVAMLTMLFAVGRGVRDLFRPRPRTIHSEDETITSGRYR